MKFSVLMSVFIKEKPRYLDACMQSLFDQTLQPEEIILVEDGPLTNELYNVIQKWKEYYPIIKSVKLEKNCGLAKALNVGLKKCNHEIIARMDSDDICFVDRFQKQIDVLQNDSSIVLLGGQVAEYDEDMKIILNYRRVPIFSKEIIKFAKIRSPFNHPTVMFKKKIIEKLGGYSEQLRNWQDYALWSVILANGYKTQNVPDVVVNMRTGLSMLERRSGLKYLKYELEAYHQVYKVGLINVVEYVLISILKILTRLLPKRILKRIYKKFLRDAK